MATVNELLKNPGSFITKLLPYVLELERNNNPFQINEAAKIVFDKQLVWGGDPLSYIYQAFYPLQNTVNQDRIASETVLLKNFQLALNSLPMAENNSWLEYQCFVDLFYQILNPIVYFTQNAEASWYTDMCPPLHQCLNGMNFYSHRIGAYKRPVTPGEGTGFTFETTVKGAIGVEEQFQLFFTMAVSPFPCPPTGHCWDLTQLENRYFTVGTGGPSGNDILVVWYDAGTGVQPVVVGPATVTYLKVEIDPFGTQEYLQITTDAAIAAQGAYSVVSSDQDGHVTLYKAAATGGRTDAADGRNGFATPVTTMYASDNTVIANNLVTDLAWQNAHNNLRIPYEKATSNADYMYIKSLANLVGVTAPGDCPPMPIYTCGLLGYFTQSIAQPIITAIPLNKAVLRDNRIGQNRLRVID